MVPAAVMFEDGKRLDDDVHTEHCPRSTGTTWGPFGTGKVLNLSVLLFEMGCFSRYKGGNHTDRKGRSEKEIV